MGPAFKPIADAGTYQRSVILGETHETRLLEFKQEYPWQRVQNQPDETTGQAEELCRDAAQFANTDGGTLIVGITERQTKDGRRVADRVQAVRNVDGFKQWAEQAIRKHLTPGG